MGINDSEVHIDMFDDRLEIYSPGGMYDGTKVQDRDIYNIPSKRRNPVIADIFNRLHFMERRGSGFKKICEDYALAESYTDEKKPRFISDSDNFTLILPNLNYGINKNVTDDVTENVTENVTDIVTEKIGKREKEVLSIISNNPHITIDELAIIMNVTRRTVLRAIKSLKDSQIIERAGSDRQGYWVIK